jgi:hypothetical protein
MGQYWLFLMLAYTVFSPAPGCQRSPFVGTAVHVIRTQGAADPC